MTKLTTYFFLTFFGLTILINSYGQTTFAKSYSVNINPEFYSSSKLILLPDSGYAFIASALDTTSSYLLFGRIDKIGNTLWTKQIDFNKSTYYCNLSLSPTNLIYLTYPSYDYSTLLYTTVVAKFNLNGNVIWSKSYGDTSFSNHGQKIVTTYTSSYIFSEATKTITGNGTDYYIQKIDTNGNFMWGKTYNSTGDDEIGSVHVLSNGDLMLTGISYLGTTILGFDSTCLIANRINQQGITTWSRRLFAPRYNLFKGQSIAEDASGNILITGKIDSIPGIGMGLWDAFVIKLSSNGTFRFGKVYGGTDYDEGWSIFSNADKKITLIAEPESFGSISRMAVIKLDSTGNLMWTKLVGNGNGGYPNSAVKNKDQGFTILGPNGDYGIPSPMLLIKVDSLGNSFCPSTPVTLGQNSFTPTIDNVINTSTLSGIISYTPQINIFSLTVIDYCTVENISENSSFKPSLLLFPNPTKKEFSITIQNSDEKINKIDIYDSFGILIFSHFCNSNKEVVEMLSVPTGLYIVNIQVNSKILSRRRVKMSKSSL